MNYQEMIDFEINIAVGKIILEYEEIKQSPQDGKALVLWSDGCNWRGFNPCNSWADAGPIIQENKISIVFNAYTWWADSRAEFIDGVKWNIDGVGDKNPLRAAMIVFIMMKGGD